MKLLKALLMAVALVGTAILLTIFVAFLGVINPIYAYIFMLGLLIVALTIMFLYMQ